MRVPQVSFFPSFHHRLGISRHCIGSSSHGSGVNKKALLQLQPYSTQVIVSWSCRALTLLREASFIMVQQVSSNYGEWLTQIYEISRSVDFSKPQLQVKDSKDLAIVTIYAICNVF